MLNRLQHDSDRGIKRLLEDLGFIWQKDLSYFVNPIFSFCVTWTLFPLVLMRVSVEWMTQKARCSSLLLFSLEFFTCFFLHLTAMIRKIGRNQVIVPQLTQCITSKDVIAVLEREPQMLKSTLIYTLSNQVVPDANGEWSNGAQFVWKKPWFRSWNTVRISDSMVERHSHLYRKALVIGQT